MGWVLGIDTSSTELGLGLYKEGTAVAGYSRYVRTSHAEHIQSAITFLMQQTQLDPLQIDRIAVAAGPGSYTGLRIGIAFVQGFSFMREVRVLAVSSLQSVAAAWQGCRSRPLVVAFDARRDEVFWARFHRTRQGVERTCADTLVSKTEFLAVLTPEDIVITDTLGYPRSSVFTQIPASIEVTGVEEVSLLRGLGCARIGAACDDQSAWCAASEITPRYLSRPYMAVQEPDREGAES